MASEVLYPAKEQLIAQKIFKMFFCSKKYLMCQNEDMKLDLFEFDSSLKPIYLANFDA